MLKKFFWGILLLIVSISFVYLGIQQVMIKSVENIKKDFFNVVNNSKATDIDYAALLRYDYSEYFEVKSVDNLKLDIVSVFHNFNNGYMNVIYSYEINNDELNKSVGADRIASKWYIKKNDSRWIVYDIEEAP